MNPQHDETEAFQLFLFVLLIVAVLYIFSLI